MLSWVPKSLKTPLPVQDGIYIEGNVFQQSFWSYGWSCWHRREFDIEIGGGGILSPPQSSYTPGLSLKNVVSVVIMKAYVKFV